MMYVCDMLVPVGIVNRYTNKRRTKNICKENVNAYAYIQRTELRYITCVAALQAS